MLTNKFNSLTKNIPQKIGVYLFYNENNEIIYIGKAKNLLKRVTQYFNDGSHKGAYFYKIISKIDYILVKNEKEALLLEINLIKEHLPRFNVIFKDNKSYPFICVVEKNDIVELQIKRNPKKLIPNCFGPYPYGTKILKIINLLNNVFQVKKCKNLTQSECIYSQMDQCIHLEKNESIKYYQQLKIEFLKFLKGDNRNIINLIKKKMTKASNEQNYEVAYEYKEIIEKIKNLKEEQKIVSNKEENSDYIGYHFEDIYILFYIIKIRNGIMIMTDFKSFEIIQQSHEALNDFANYYYKNFDKPKYLFVEFKNIKIEGIEVRIPKIGKRKKLLNLANQNAELHFKKEKINFYKFELRNKIWNELAIISNLEKINFWEIYDASHLMGDEYVGCKIEFSKLGQNKNRNRKYNLNEIKSSNDFLAFKKMISKRFLNDKKIPQLIIVDGGLIQINAVKSQLKELNIKTIVMGLVKNNLHKTSHLVNDKNKKLDISKELFLYLKNAQDLIHKFAISYHNKSRRNKITKSFLDDIKGLGEKKKFLLLSKFNTFNDIKGAKVEYLEKIVGKNIANKIKKML